MNEFLLASKESKSEQLEMILCGISPARKFEERLSSLRERRFPREKGAFPEKLLAERSRVSTLPISPIQSGISPTREFPRSRTKLQDARLFIETGRFPEK